MKELLIITSYYPPETGAASNRISHLANGLLNHGYKVSAVTPLPNYPTGKIFPEYKSKKKRATLENGIQVYRLWIYASNSKNKLLRLFAMLSYSISLISFFIRNKIPNKVIIQSPPLLVAFTCLLFLKRKHRKLILNVSDLWPLAGLELGVFKKNLSYKLLQKIERFNYNKADLILGQSEEIITHVKTVLPNKNTFIYRNFPAFEAPSIPNRNETSSKIQLVYAGLLGVAQGIYKLIQELDFSNIELHLYGNGAEREAITAYIEQNKHLPLFYHGELSRESLHKELMQYDATIVPLVNRIYGSVPSKIFEYARLGLPCIYFSGGEGESLVESYKLGWTVDV
ncbi:MAG TPA: glycosyltransferase family 4 protein, partial [Flavobacteriaceae bacterium]|nr:glycosyltransferase family 4 protein [Flavobacteriaceae bacterium]